jgi:hypothetical protein
MKMHFVAAAALALVSLGACSANPQMASANDTQCVPTTVGDVSPSPGYDVGAHCNPTGSNPFTALWTAITGGPSTAQASAPATQPSG